MAAAEAPHREPVTDPDAWEVYTAIGSNVIVSRYDLWRALRIDGWTRARFDAAVNLLRNTGVIDFVTCIQKHRPTYDRLELPLKE